MNRRRRISPPSTIPRSIAPRPTTGSAASGAAIVLAIVQAVAAIVRILAAAEAASAGVDAADAVAVTSARAAVAIFLLRSTPPRRAANAEVTAATREAMTIAAATAVIDATVAVSAGAIRIAAATKIAVLVGTSKIAAPNPHGPPNLRKNRSFSPANRLRSIAIARPPAHRRRQSKRSISNLKPGETSRNRAWPGSRRLAVLRAV